MRCICTRLHGGDDIMLSIKDLCKTEHIRAGVILSGVGCVLHTRLRDAGGVNIHEIAEHMEIVSMTGTVSENRCHIHISLSKEDLSTIGGHMTEGCIVNTTCELVIGELEGTQIVEEFDVKTGYGEAVFKRL